ncbi:MAG: Gram-negative bacterial tonB protein [Parcubacteria group bacterium ADurb.Bin216]|nr:MAG: Gram-negative bacterial tonB protein [Parcubacteria group bacterium ADurb.Bin216]
MKTFFIFLLCFIFCQISIADEVKRKPPFPSYVATVKYPDSLFRLGIEGTTIVAVEILSGGTVGRIAIEKSSGNKRLDKAAEEAIKNWKFSLEKGDAWNTYPEYLNIPVSFKIKDKRDRHSIFNNYL